MKKLNILGIVMLSCTVSTAFCQSSTSPQPESSGKKIKITDASVMGGFVNQNIPVVGSLADFQKLNPQSELLKENMAGYSEGRNYFGFGNNSSYGGVFGAVLGLSFKEKPKSLTQLRCGISISGINLNNSISKTQITPYDTLTSSQTGQTIYYDSTTTSRYSMNYNAQQLHLDFSLIYRLYPAARWSMYGGVGLSAGASLMAYTDINYSENSTVGSGSTGDRYNDGVYRSERVINKGIKEYVGYLPVGVDFRVGRKKEFLKQIHLFMELRPFVSVMDTQELGTFSSTGVKNTFGLRVTI